MGRTSTNDSLVEFGRTVKDLRKRKGWTQTDLAQKAGTTKSVVSQWESGEMEPRMGSLKKLADALDVSVATLIGVEGEGYQLGYQHGFDDAKNRVAEALS